MGTAAFVAYLSALCNVAYTATQYALLSSFMAAGRTSCRRRPAGWSRHLNWAGAWTGIDRHSAARRGRAAGQLDRFFPADRARRRAGPRHARLAHAQGPAAPCEGAGTDRSLRLTASADYDPPRLPQGRDKTRQARRHGEERPVYRDLSRPQGADRRHRRAHVRPEGQPRRHHLRRAGRDRRVHLHCRGARRHQPAPTSSASWPCLPAWRTRSITCRVFDMGPVHAESGHITHRIEVEGRRPARRRRALAGGVRPVRRQHRAHELRAHPRATSHDLYVTRFAVSIPPNAGPTPASPRSPTPRARCT